MNLLDYARMKRHLGMTIPVWFPPGTDGAVISSNLRTALTGWERYLRPESIALSVDGCAEAAEVIDRISADPNDHLLDGMRIVVAETNEGKGRAVAEGFRELLKDDRLEYLAARDVDGDHLINDLENLYRLALQAAGREAPGVLVIGRRHNLHAPLGFERAEFEIWVDRCLLEAIQYRLARSGLVFDRALCSVYSDAPDFQSGYKLYSRSVVETFLPLVLDPPANDRETIGRSSEVVPLVEAVLAGAAVAEVTRMTAGQQPISGFSGIDRAAFYGAKLEWAFRRLEIEPQQAVKILDNHLARSTLFWSASGREELMAARAAALGGRPGPAPTIPEII